MPSPTFCLLPAVCQGQAPNSRCCGITDSLVHVLAPLQYQWSPALQNQATAHAEALSSTLQYRRPGFSLQAHCPAQRCKAAPAALSHRLPPLHALLGGVIGQGRGIVPSPLCRGSDIVDCSIGERLHFRTMDVHFGFLMRAMNACAVLGQS